MPYGLQEDRRLVLHHLVDRGTAAYAKGRMHLPNGVGVQQLPPAIGVGQLRRWVSLLSELLATLSPCDGFG